MLNRLILGVFVLVFSALGLSALSNNSTVYASASSEQACLSLDKNLGVDCSKDTSSSGKNTIYTLVKKIVDTLSVIVGIITVFMIIIAGLQFITSGGDSNRVSKARTALTYSIIGLLVVALAQFLVRFVLNNITA